MKIVSFHKLISHKTMENWYHTLKFEPPVENRWHFSTNSKTNSCCVKIWMLFCFLLPRCRFRDLKFVQIEHSYEYSHYTCIRKPQIDVIYDCLWDYQTKSNIPNEWGNVCLLAGVRCAIEVIISGNEEGMTIALNNSILKCMSSNIDEECKYSRSFIHSRAKAFAKDVWMRFDLRLLAIIASILILNATFNFWYWSQERYHCF